MNLDDAVALHIFAHGSQQRSVVSTLFIRKLEAKPDVSYESYRTYIETRPVDDDHVCPVIACQSQQDRKTVAAIFSDNRGGP